MTKLSLSPSEADGKAGAVMPVQAVHAQQVGTIVTATLLRMLVTEKSHLRSVQMSAGTTGSGNDTDVQVHRNGVQVGNEGTLDNADADDLVRNVAINQDFEAGDILEVIVTAAPTAGADLSVDGVLLRDYQA